MIFMRKFKRKFTKKRISVNPNLESNLTITYLLPRKNFQFKIYTDLFSIFIPPSPVYSINDSKVLSLCNKKAVSKRATTEKEKNIKKN
jgi:hypothetical protein